MYTIIVNSNEIFRKGIRYTLSHGCNNLLTEEHAQLNGFFDKVAEYQPTSCKLSLNPINEEVWR